MGFKRHEDDEIVVSNLSKCTFTEDEVWYCWARDSLAVLREAIRHEPEFVQLVVLVAGGGADRVCCYRRNEGTSSTTWKRLSGIEEATKWLYRRPRFHRSS